MPSEEEKYEIIDHLDPPESARSNFQSLNTERGLVDKEQPVVEYMDEEHQQPNKFKKLSVKTKYTEDEQFAQHPSYQAPKVKKKPPKI